MEMEKNQSGYWIKWKVRKPCPFCGGKAEIDEFKEAEAYEPSYYYQGEVLRCTGCGVTFKRGKHDYSTEEVPYYDVQYNKEVREQMRMDLIKQWNKRV